MFFKSPRKSKQWRCRGKLSPRPAVHSQLAWCLAREVWNWARGWVSECTGTGTRLRLRHGGNPAPARSPGSDVREHRRMSAPGASQHVCPVASSVQVPAGELLSSLARRSTCSAWTHLAAGARRGRGNGRVVTLPFISPVPVSLAPGPFSPHICRLTLSWPAHQLTGAGADIYNTRHRGQARHHVT